MIFGRSTHFLPRVKTISNGFLLVINENFSGILNPIPLKLQLFCLRQNLICWSFISFELPEFVTFLARKTGRIFCGPTVPSANNVIERKCQFVEGDLGVNNNFRNKTVWVNCLTDYLLKLIGKCFNVFRK